MGWQDGKEKAWQAGSVQLRVREAKKGSGKMTGRADHGNSKKKKLPT